MPYLYKALLIGLAAGIVDVVPMMLRKLNKYACWSAFVHWVVLGTIIPLVPLDLAPWLKGLILGELATLPVMIIVMQNDKKAIIPIAIFSAMLGIGTAVAGAAWIG